MLGPVVTIAGMFGPVLRVILLPVPWQGGLAVRSWPGEHPLKLETSTGAGASQVAIFPSR